jgi:hypothetical protein
MRCAVIEETVVLLPERKTEMMKEEAPSEGTTMNEVVRSSNRIGFKFLLMAPPAAGNNQKKKKKGMEAAVCCPHPSQFECGGN